MDIQRIHTPSVLRGAGLDLQAPPARAASILHQKVLYKYCHYSMCCDVTKQESTPSKVPRGNMIQKKELLLY